jgi:uncharacterized membrane protein YbhN (UPF0104 family)
MDADRQPVPPATARRARRRRTTWLRYALGLAAIGAVAAFSARQRELLDGFAAAVTHLTWYWVLAAFAAELASVPPLAEAQRMVLRAASSRTNYTIISLYDVTWARRAGLDGPDPGGGRRGER